MCPGFTSFPAFLRRLCDSQNASAAVRSKRVRRLSDGEQGDPKGGQRVGLGQHGVQCLAAFLDTRRMLDGAGFDGSLLVQCLGRTSGSAWAGVAV